MSQVTVPGEKRNDKTFLGLLNVGAELTFISGDSVSQWHFVVGAYVSLMINCSWSLCESDNKFKNKTLFKVQFTVSMDPSVVIFSVPECIFAIH